MAVTKKLRKVELTTTKDYAVGDARQMPAAATVEVFKQGCIYVSGGPVNVSATNVTLTVRDHGRIIVGDTLVKERDVIDGTVNPPKVTVDTVTPGGFVYWGGDQAAQVRVDHTSGGNMTLTAGDRLIVTSNKPTLYPENSAAATALSNPTTTDGTTGYGRFYIPERFVDMKVAVAGMTAQMLRDHSAGEAGKILNADDFPTLQDAIDHARMGQSIYVPAGEWDLATHGSSGTLVIDQAKHQTGLHIFGEHWGTKLVQKDENTDCIKFVNTSTDSTGNFIIERMTIRGDDTPGTGYGIHIDSTNVAPAFISNVVLRDMEIREVGYTGIYCRYVSRLLIQNVNVVDVNHIGIEIKECPVTSLFHNVVYGSRDIALHLYVIGGGLNVIGGEYSSPHAYQTGKAATDGCIRLNTVHQATLLSVDMEGFSDDEVGQNTQTGISAENCTTLSIQNLSTYNLGEGTSSCAIDLDNCDYAFIGPTYMHRVAEAINVASDCTHITILEPMVGDGTCAVTLPTGSNADAKGYIYLSTNGIKMPQYESASKPTASAALAGMIIYERNNGGNTGQAMMCQQTGVGTYAWTGL